MSRSRARCYVGHLRENAVSTRDLADLFSRYGRIVDIQIKSNYGFVEFETDQMADAAVLELNRRDFMGDRLVVEHSNARGGSKKVRSPPPPPFPPPSLSDISRQPGVFGGHGSTGYSSYAVPSQPPYHNYGSYPAASYPGDRAGSYPGPYPAAPLPPAPSRLVQDRWSSPPRGAPPRRRSRSRSPVYRSGSSSKRSRRSSPLRIRRSSRSRSRERRAGGGSSRITSVGGGGGVSSSKDNKFDIKTTARTSWRICVENLTPSTTWQDLRQHFDEIGQVVYSSVASDASGFVEFVSREMVAKAIEKLNNTYLRGVRIQVINAIPPEEDEIVVSAGGDGNMPEPTTETENGHGDRVAAEAEEEEPEEEQEKNTRFSGSNAALEDEQVNEFAPEASTNGNNNGLDSLHDGEPEPEPEAAVTTAPQWQSTNGHTD